jgi:putative membrane protein
MPVLARFLPLVPANRVQATQARHFSSGRCFITMNSLPCSALALRLSFVSAIGLLGALLNDVYAAGPRTRQVSARSFSNGFAVEPVAINDLRPTERAFLTKAMETIRQQMRLAEIGVSQATSSSVRSHAQQLAGDYRSLNEALDALIRRKGGIANAPVGGTSETFRKLVENVGPDFDREFVRAVGQLTDAALALFEQAAADVKDTDVREFAAAELPVLRGHRSEVTDLQKTVD